MSLARHSLAALVLSAVFVSPACLGSGSSINAYGGSRSLENNDFDSLDDQTVYGADAVLKLDLPWLAVEGGWFHSDDDSGTLGTLTDVELDIDEYFVGLRVTPWDILIEPYASIGATYVDTSLDAQSGAGSVDDGDETLAYYARLGAAFHIGLIRLGLDARALLGSDVELDTIDSDVDNLQIAAFAGVRF